MRANRLIPIAVLAFAAACSDDATSPTSLTSVGGPLAFQITPGSYTDDLADPQTGIQDANAPSGGHLTNQSATPTCVVNADFSIDCNSYSIGGVGNTNAVATLIANYSATVDCNNPGNNRNNPIETHTSSFADTSSATLTPGRNGTLRVTGQSADPGEVEQVCPNDNWIPEIRGGTVTLESFSYTLTFVGFSAPAVEIDGL
jgi:hypothetical protein